MGNFNTTNRRVARTYFNFQDLMSKSLIMPNGCIEWQMGICKDGYAQLAVSYKHQYVHRLVATMFYGEPNGRFALHSCDNRPCINPDHLRWGTHQDNTDDRINRNRHVSNAVKGIDHPRAKLDEADVIELRRLIAAGLSQRKVAKQFGLTQSTVYAIVHRKIWKHI